jgi:tetratricopeptide (TPR) repeat protein
MFWCNKGILFFRMSKLEEALFYFNVAIKLNLDEAFFWVVKAQTEEKLNRKADALKSYQTFVSKASNNPIYSDTLKEAKIAIQTLRK